MASDAPSYFVFLLTFISFSLRSRHSHSSHSEEKDSTSYPRYGTYTIISSSSSSSHLNKRKFSSSTDDIPTFSIFDSSVNLSPFIPPSPPSPNTEYFFSHSHNYSLSEGDNHPPFGNSPTFSTSARTYNRSNLAYSSTADHTEEEAPFSPPAHFQASPYASPPFAHSNSISISDSIPDDEYPSFFG